VFVLYLVSALLLFDGIHILSDPARRIAGPLSPDKSFFVWALRWWPYAAGHLTNPFLSKVIWAPTGYNVAWATAVPLPSMVMSPVTVALGPVVSFNLLTFLAPASAAWTAYLLTRHLTRAAIPSVVAGFLFGFSSYEMNMLSAGQLDLSLVFVLPLIAYLVVRHLDGSLGSIAFAVLLGLALAAQFLIFAEVFATATMVGALACLLGLAFAQAEWRRRIARTVVAAAGSYAVAGVLLSPFLVAMFVYPRPTKAHVAVSDLARAARSWTTIKALVEPGSGNAIGGAICHCGVNGLYLSIPVIVILILILVMGWRRPVVRTFAVLFVLIVAMALGPALRVGSQFIVLPWRLFGALPGLSLASPKRLIVYAMLLASVGIAVWWSSKPSRLRTASVGLAVLALFPSVSAIGRSAPVRFPPFIASGEYRQFVDPGETVIVVGRDKGEDMLWQAETDVYFRVAGGYTGNTPPNFAGSEFVSKLFRGNVDPADTAALQRFLAQHRVGAVIVDDRSPAYVAALTSWLGVSPREIGGVQLFRLSSNQP
jgi:dolichyl-phosphate beta-glucosyltransferase